MRHYYRLMIAVAAAVALGAMAALGAEAADPGDEPIGFFELYDSDGNAHCFGIVKDWDEGGARPVFAFADDADCEPEAPEPEPTPTPVADRQEFQDVVTDRLCVPILETDGHMQSCSQGVGHARVD